MKDPNLVKQELQNQIEEIVEELFKKIEIKFEKPAQPEHGDFACNIALRLASEYKENPREVADKIAESIELPDEIAKLEVAGPGFINFSFSDKYLIQAIKNPESVLDNKTESGTIVVDYSQPNIAKPLGVHHLLSTIIGQSMVNIYKSKGYKTVSVNYMGDWGTQFGKLIHAYKTWGDKAKVEADPIPELLKLYVEFHEKVEQDPSIEDKGREEFLKLEQGDEENRKLWEWITQLSKDENQKVYDLLGGIHFDSDRAEAACEPFLPALLEEGKKLGIFVEGEEGAYIVDLGEDTTPFVVQKSDGATLYSTRDIETVKHRLTEYDPIKLVYVVDVAQKLHFEQLFATVKKFPWYDEEVELYHLKFGRMRFADRKMSTRKGNILSLLGVLEEGIQKAKTVIEEKNPNLENKDEVARMVGTGSAKYSVLSSSPETDIVFDWEKILSFEGNSAPYLQYSYARASSILREVDVDLDYSDDYSLNQYEAAVVRKLITFKEAINEAANRYKPNIIANYLYDLAQTYNTFYTNCQVLNAETDEAREVRVAIVKLFAEVMKEGLNLLGGIEAPEKM